MAAAQVQELFDRSDWVIRGTVRTAGAATMPEVPASPNTFVVRVDDVLEGPDLLDDQIGREITLFTNAPAGLRARSRAVFFTTSWLYGRSVAVIEVGRIPERKARTVAGDIEKASQVAADRRLRERIAKATLVVAGEVTDIGRGPQEERPIETEHAPDWATAHVKVVEVLKGRAPGDVVPVVFPRSMDELWIDSPKFRSGDAAVFILQRNQKEKGWPVLRVPGLTALDQLDRQPVEELDRIRELVRGIG